MSFQQQPLRLTAGSVHTTLGTVDIRPVQPEQDTQRLHRWITHPRSKFWGAVDATVQDIRSEYDRITASPYEQAWILHLGGQPVALSETYDPRYVVLNRCPEAHLCLGDVGMHILIAPPQGPARHGFTDVVMSALVRWIFGHPWVERIVVEPDAKNAAIHRKNARAGFGQPGTAVTLTVEAADPESEHGHKSALIQYCTRPGFLGSQVASLSYAVPQTPWELVELSSPAAASKTSTEATPPDTNQVPPHTSLGVSHLARVAEATHRELFAKALREFTHERLIEPHPLPELNAQHNAANTASGWVTYRVRWGSRNLEFRARPHALLHLSVDPDSIRDPEDPTWTSDIIQGITEAADQLGIPESFRDTYLEEISATFAARARTVALPRPTAEELTDTSRDPVELYQAIESATVVGHPGFLANSGRAGMGETHLRAYSPELGASTDLVWCAVDKRYAHLASMGNHAKQAHQPEAARQLLKQLVPDFESRCTQAGLDPDNYLPLPVHPWQWEQRFTTTFAGDLAAGRIVPLGRGGQAYRPQQSLRTFFNYSSPAAPYVKTAVAVRNMGFTRGLSAHYMASIPHVNAWLLDLLSADPEFTDSGVGFLPEIATVAYTGDVFHRRGSDGPHSKMTAALWRQSPFDAATTPAVQEGDTLSTLAGILLCDAAGEPLVGAWIRHSGLAPEVWVHRLLRVYLRPLLHALLRYGVAFMPHTENVILRLHDGVPVGIYHKDLGEEVTVISQHTPLPEELQRLRASNASDSPEDLAQQALSIHTDVIDGVLRHLAALLDDHGILTEVTFWHEVQSVAAQYAADYPELTGSAEGTARPTDLAEPQDSATPWMSRGQGLWKALLAPEFRHSTLNRLQLRNPHTMVDLSDQNSSLLYAGTLTNPLHSPKE